MEVDGAGDPIFPGEQGRQRNDSKRVFFEYCYRPCQPC